MASTADNNDQTVVIIGKFGKVHGVKGLLKVHSNTNPSENMLLYQPWLIKREGRWQSVEMHQVQNAHHHIIAQIEGVNTVEEATLYVNKEIATPRDQLPPPKKGEYYWMDLIGMNVTNLEGTTFGKVVELMSTGAHDVLVIEGDKRYLIPFVKERYVRNVNLQEKTILVDWNDDFI